MEQLASLISQLLRPGGLVFKAAPAPARHKKFDKGPDSRNPLMIQFFEWDSKGHATKSWWRVFEDALPELEELGFTQVWLPRGFCSFFYFSIMPDSPAL
ncbi:glycoside hydrolase family 13 protein [Serendipita vermifera MAFF 305830]|uniref:Glycoside hydrolase family 13 protein n=1 Tax=Serendipita vermifera MAFF 305830 TaxID=933852 RepID=A0A0C3ASD9_SERVB|nr:glycoside hydrolase family 13 protein [Serendipita vermifera MAFF 305830]